MTIDAFQLLRKLEPAVRPGMSPARGQTGAVPFEQRGFDDLLALVSTGVMGEGLPVRTGPGVELEMPLEPEQLARLAAAADMAGSAGARRALLLIDGRALVLDVPGRALTAELTDAASHEVVEIDAAVHVAAHDGIARTSGAVPPPGTGLVPPGIADQFRSVSGTGSDSTIPAARRAS